jgi:hypothetical protein
LQVRFEKRLAENHLAAAITKPAREFAFRAVEEQMRLQPGFGRSRNHCGLQHARIRVVVRSVVIETEKPAHGFLTDCQTGLARQAGAQSELAFVPGRRADSNGAC